MGNLIEGVIEKMHTKSGTGKRGTWTKYSAVINGGWVNFGFDNPGYEEGQTIKVQVEEDQYGKQVKQHRLADVQVANKPADAPKNTSSGGTGNMGMAWGNASNVAAALITTLEKVDGLPLTASAGKANKAKRFDETLEIFDKLRVKLYKDSLDPQRVIDMYPDFGEVVTNDPKALPDGEVPDGLDDDGFEPASADVGDGPSDF
jgi:hypothetical protein